MSIYCHCKTSLAVDWQPVVRIKPFVKEYSEEPIHGPFVGFITERLWVALFPNGELKQCQWYGKEKGNLLPWCKGFSWNIERDGPFTPPCHIQGYRETYYLPYSDELWERLEYMQQKIIELRVLFDCPLYSPRRV